MIFLKQQRYWIATLTGIGIIAIVAPAQALQFNFSYGDGVSFNAIGAIQNAGAAWEGLLKDDVTLNVHVRFSDSLPVGILGGGEPGMVRANYKDYLTALQQDTTSANDITAIQNLNLVDNDQSLFNKYLAGDIQRNKLKAQTTSVNLLMDGRFNSSGTGSYLDNNGNDNNKKIWLTRANAKALNLLSKDDAALDTSIVLSSKINWDYNRADGTAANAFDLMTVIQHELGHTLGFVSGTDVLEYLAMTAAGNSGTPLAEKSLAYVAPMDLYRYSSTSAALGVPDLTLGGTNKYLSLDGGATAISSASLATGGPAGSLATGGTAVGGSGNQGSHWQASVTPLGIMNPSLKAGQQINISNLDLTLLDAIGYDVTTRNEQLMQEMGLNWQGFKQQLDNRRQTLVQSLSQQWTLANPGQSIQEELAAEAEDDYGDLDPQIEQKLAQLKQKLTGVSDPLKRTEEINKKMAEIWALVKAKDDRLTKLTADMRDANQQVLGWLSKKTSDLAVLLEDANRLQMKALSWVLSHATPAQRLLWEDKLSDALALFLDNPQKALDKITKSNYFNSPIGWGGAGTGTTGGGTWNGWFQSTDEAPSPIAFNDSLEYTAEETDPVASQSVPEPSSVLGLLGLGLGLLIWRKHP